MSTILFILLNKRIMVSKVITTLSELISITEKKEKFVVVDKSISRFIANRCKPKLLNVTLFDTLTEAIAYKAAIDDNNTLMCMSVYNYLTGNRIFSNKEEAIMYGADNGEYFKVIIHTHNGSSDINEMFNDDDRVLCEILASTSPYDYSSHEFVETKAQCIYKIYKTNANVRGEVNTICYEHQDDIDYPFLCPKDDTNYYSFEIED